MQKDLYSASNVLYLIYPGQQWKGKTMKTFSGIIGSKVKTEINDQSVQSNSNVFVEHGI